MGAERDVDRVADLERVPVIAELHGRGACNHHPVFRTLVVILQRQVMPRIDGQPLHLAGCAVEQILEHAPWPILVTVFGGDCFIA